MKIPSLERKTFWGAWLLAAWFNGILGFILYSLFFGGGLAHSHPKDLLALPLAAIPLGLLAWAVRETFVWKIYGQSFFSSDANYVPWPGQMEGRIIFDRPPGFTPDRTFKVTLLCQAEGGSGKSRQVQKLWSDSHLEPVQSEGTIPIRFALPPTVKEANLFCSYQLFWYLNVQQVPWSLRSFSARYVIPVNQVQSGGDS